MRNANRNTTIAIYIEIRKFSIGIQQCQPPIIFLVNSNHNKNPAPCLFNLFFRSLFTSLKYDFYFC